MYRFDRAPFMWWGTKLLSFVLIMLAIADFSYLLAMMRTNGALYLRLLAIIITIALLFAPYLFLVFLFISIIYFVLRWPFTAPPGWRDIANISSHTTTSLPDCLWQPDDLSENHNAAPPIYRNLPVWRWHPIPPLLFAFMLLWSAIGLTILHFFALVMGNQSPHFMLPQSPFDWYFVLWAPVLVLIGCISLFAQFLHAKTFSVRGESNGLWVRGSCHPWTDIRAIIALGEMNMHNPPEQFWFLLDDGAIFLQHQATSTTAKKSGRRFVTLTRESDAVLAIVALARMRTQQQISFLKYPTQRQAPAEGSLDALAETIRFFNRRSLADWQAAEADPRHQSHSLGAESLVEDAAMIEERPTLRPEADVRVHRDFFISSILLWVLAQILYAAIFGTLLAIPPTPVLIGTLVFSVSASFVISRRTPRWQATWLTLDRAGPHGMRCMRTLPGLRWDEIEAWGYIEPAIPDPKSVTYALYGQGQTILWRELRQGRLVGRHVRGDRHAAYVAMTEAIHATITSRTGMAPRVFRMAP